VAVGDVRGEPRGLDRITIEADELIEAGDRVVAAVLQRGVGKESGAEVDFRYFHVWSFRGGKVVRLEVIRERREAFEVAGLSGRG
jgi:ketosteroid isomerase-like protein